MTATIDLSRVGALMEEFKASPIGAEIYASILRSGSAKLIARCDILLKDPELTEVEFDNIRCFRAEQIAKHGEPDPRAMMEFIKGEYVPILDDTYDPIGWKMKAARAVYRDLAKGLQ